MTDSPADDLPALRTNPADQSGTQQFIPAETRALLGPAPITHLEDGDAYERVLSKMAEAVAPIDFVEWIWLKRRDGHFFGRFVPHVCPARRWALAA
jgi:hypothetical protein